MKTSELIVQVCNEVKDLLLQKNAAYGDSALNPVRIFSKGDPIEQINVRIDDKLSRLARGNSAGEDTELDLIGYLILKRVARRNLKRPPVWTAPPCVTPIPDAAVASAVALFEQHCQYEAEDD